jgi:hypothetical protein
MPVSIAIHVNGGKLLAIGLPAKAIELGTINRVSAPFPSKSGAGGTFLPVQEVPPLLSSLTEGMAGPFIYRGSWSDPGRAKALRVKHERDQRGARPQQYKQWELLSR